LASPADLFQVALNISGLELGAPRFDYSIPDLDVLRAAAVQTMGKKLAEQPSEGVVTDTAKLTEDVPLLYDSRAYSHTGKVRISIRSDTAGIVSHTADGFINEPEESMKQASYKSLTFKTLLGESSQFQLPFIFSQLELEYNSSGDVLQGYIWEYDPKLPSELGIMHAVRGEIVKDNPIASSVLVAKTTASPFTAAAPPAMTSQVLAARQVKSLDITWLKALRLDNDNVTRTAQQLIYKAMLYHMSDEDLKDFIGENRPVISADDLPQELGTGLEKEIKDWLLTKYTPAYVALRVIQTSDTVKENWKVNFSKEEAKKVYYFWRGRGENCLSKSGYYAKLNDLAVRLAILRQNPDLNNYLTDNTQDDKGLTGGPKWAAKLFAVLTTSQEVKNMIIQMQILQSNVSTIMLVAPSY
jgi:hypothetical protein